MKLSANDLLSRMSPTTMIALLGDIIEMGNLDTVESEIVSVIAYEFITIAGIEDAINMLNSAGIAHPLIDIEIEEARRQEEE